MSNTQFLAKGKLRFTFAGYAFSSGGEKQSFGYLPHLKDENGNPVFPDKQIDGNLQMSGEWLKKLGEDASLHDIIFGSNTRKDKNQENNEQNPNDSKKQHPSKLYITDLTLENLDETENLFCVKPRIEINDKTGICEDKKLINIELSYLKGKTLTADIYLGYFSDKQQLQQAVEYVNKCSEMLSAVGAFRSRGYGRGKAEISWEDIQEVQIAPTQQVQDICYFLTSLVHFRNATVHPGHTQTIETYKFITKGQIRGWFCKTYNDVFGKWPTDAEMENIQFSDLYPAQSDGHTLAYPPAATTFTFENGTISDFFGKQKSEDESQATDQEGLLKTKAKPLGDNVFVINSNPIKTIEVPVYRRFHNQINDDFTTATTGGLFAQEYLPQNTCFGGKIQFRGDDQQFQKNAYAILQNFSPTIKGCIFSSHIESQSSQEEKTTGNLLTSAIPLTKELLKYQQQQQINVAVVKRYHAPWNRAKRHRIVVKEGSILAQQTPETISWKGFGQELPTQQQSNQTSSPALSSDRGIVHQETVIKMSRTQAGLLRDLCHPDRSTQEIEKSVQRILEKYARWKIEEDKKNLIPTVVLQHILDLLQRGTEEMREYIRSLLSELALHWWEEKKKKQIESCKEDLKEAGISWRENYDQVQQSN